MKRLLFISVLLWAGLQTVCLARLNETRTECDGRYNPTTEPPAYASLDKEAPLKLGVTLETRSYDYQGWLLRIGFYDGRAVCIEYSRGRTSIEAVADDAVQKILEANIGRRRNAWRHVQYNPYKDSSPANALLSKHARTAEFWVRADGALAYRTGIGNPGNIFRLEYGAPLRKVLAELGTTAAKEPLPQF